MRKLTFLNLLPPLFVRNSAAARPTPPTLRDNLLKTWEYNRRLEPCVRTSGFGMRFEYSDRMTNDGNVQSPRIRRRDGWSALRLASSSGAGVVLLLGHAG